MEDSKRSIIKKESGYQGLNAFLRIYSDHCESHLVKLITA